MSLRDALRRQAETCQSMGSPFTARLLRLLADRLAPGTPLTDRLFDWPGDISASGQSIPLRLAGALHGLVLEGQDAQLSACYPPNDADDAALWRAVHGAMSRHGARLDAWLDQTPQTNELGRSAVLIAAGHLLADRFGLPLVLSELGASAGLNLMWDHFAVQTPQGRLGPDAPSVTLTPDWQGEVPSEATPCIAARRGVDLHPLQPEADRLRLLAYIWPDQAERLARTQAAISICQARVDRGDAADWIEARLAAPFPGQCHMIYHTVAWQYFPEAVQARARAAIEAAGSRTTPDAPIAWFGMEADDQTPGAGLTLRLWPGGGAVTVIGRADFHARWVDWRAPRITS